MPDDLSAHFSPLQAMPENTQAEHALLSALIVKPQLLEHLPAFFEPSHYYDPLHEDVHRTLVEVGQPGVPAGIAVIQALNMDDKGRKYVASLLSGAISYQPSSIVQYASAVTEMHRRRGVLELIEQMKHAVLDNTPDASADRAIAQAMTALDNLTSRRPDARPHTMIQDAADAALAAAERVYKGGGLAGLSTGFPSIDQALDGLEPGTVTVLAGRPGMGKSALGHQIALNVAAAGHGVVEISLEMSAAALGRRSLSAISGVPLERLKRGMLDPATSSRLTQARMRLQDLPLSIEDGGGLTAGMIAIKVRAAQRRHGVKLIMIDHLHIVRPDDQDKRNGATASVAGISNAMKRLAKDMNCAVLLLAQLSRGPEGRDDKRPNLGDLRQSGDIEQDADAVAFLYRAEYYLGAKPDAAGSPTAEQASKKVREWHDAKERLAGKAELILAKVRDGETKTVPLLFDGPTTSFAEDHTREGSL